MTLIAGLSMVCSLSALSAGRAAATTTNAFLYWNPVYLIGTPTYTISQANQLAKHSSTIVAAPASFRSHVADMKVANPSLKIYAYMNAVFAKKTDGTLYTDGWYLHTASGAKVRSTDYGNYMMNPRSTGWINNRSKACAQIIVDSGYDGCFLDMLGVGSLSPGYLNGAPIDPKTGQPWTQTALAAANAALANSVKTANGGHVTTGNGIGNGRRYFQPGYGSMSLARTLPGGMMAELFARQPVSGATVFPAEDTWRADVDMLADAEAHGDGILTVTKLWTTATTAQVAQWRRLTIGTFMLGAGGHSAMSFLVDSTSAPAAPSPYTPALGAPSGPYTRAASGLYKRSFGKGLVLVNPSSNPISFTLPAAYTDLDGAPAAGAITVPPHDAEILTKAV